MLNLFRYFTLCGLLGACSKPAPSSEANPSPAKTDVIVIMIDTLRADHLPIHGYKKNTSPFLTQWAEESAVFNTAWSTSSWTAPSTASVFTGLYPNQHGVTLGLFAPSHDIEKMRAGEESQIGGTALPQELTTLPEFFKEAGYNTFGVAANINLGPELGFQSGFDEFHYVHQASARELATKLVSWTGKIRSGPSFVYMHLNDVHSPYLKRDPWYVPSTDLVEDMKAAYDSEINYTDLYIQRMIEHFDWQDDLVFVITDHGEEFFDHGQEGHLTTLYRELSQVVWMVHGPQIKPQRITGNASLVDVLPTLLGLTELEVPEEMAGISLAGQLTGSSDQEKTLWERPVFQHRAERQSLDESKWRDLWGVTHKNYRLITEKDQSELYDLTKDIAETNNLAERQSAVVDSLRETLRSFQADPGKTWKKEIYVDLDKVLYEQLKTIGYVE